MSAIVDYLNQRVKSKGHLVNKNHSYVTPRTGVSSFPDEWNFFQNVKFFMIMRSFSQFHSLYVTVWQKNPEHFFKKPWLIIYDLQKIWFIIKKKYGGRIFFGKWWNPKSGKKSMIWAVLVDFFLLQWGTTSNQCTQVFLKGFFWSARQSSSDRRLLTKSWKPFLWMSLNNCQLMVCEGRRIYNNQKLRRFW